MKQDTSWYTIHHKNTLCVYNIIEFLSKDKMIDSKYSHLIEYTLTNMHNVHHIYILRHIFPGAGSNQSIITSDDGVYAFESTNIKTLCHDVQVVLLVLLPCPIDLNKMTSKRMIIESTSSTNILISKSQNILVTASRLVFAPN